MNTDEQGRMAFVRGNVLEPQRIEDDEFVIIPHCCNNLGVMGAGVALGIKQKWPDAVASYLNYHTTVGHNILKNMLGEVIWGEVDGTLVVANMIGQDGTASDDNPKPVKYWALLKAMQNTLSLVGRYVPAEGLKIVFHCPKFGSELAGGDWHVIEALIRETWCERGFDVVIYEFEMEVKKWGPMDKDSIDVYNGSFIKD